jgi:hypothetical protein
LPSDDSRDRLRWDRRGLVIMSTPKVQWPAKAYAADGEDLSAPITQLLIDLRLLENPLPNEKVTWQSGTPQSLQVMTGGATSISKWIAAAVAGVGGLSALATGLNGFFVAVGPAGLDTPLVRTAFILGGSVLGAAVAIALAILVRSDLTARAHATAAQFEARGAVASALINSFVVPEQPPVEVPGYAIQTADKSWCAVERFVWREGKLVAKTEDDYVPHDEWLGIVPSGA